ncbi:hypothetical protein DPMN_018452 [Dreissena polymorpha]|uniref:Uncharacterized protein n=1 Tax=Dreissena polymorpha TaxID=45954 RepID=A0A9D4NIE5_DREPO|nr:hypothetical protein DPMN_018451 [Dreissena polymorpha]KAH3894295.1 hypothetical protein DPMN_018452 [Dreissena polymorpha]
MSNRIKCSNILASHGQNADPIQGRKHSVTSTATFSSTQPPSQPEQHQTEAEILPETQVQYSFQQSLSSSFKSQFFGATFNIQNFHPTRPRTKLPPGELPPYFKGGGERRRTAPLSEFRAENCPPSHVDRTWLKSSVWGPENWSVFGRSVRTNNDCEGWHLKLNQHAKKANLPFHLLLTLLCEEASLLPTQATTKEEQVSPGKNLQAVGSVRERRIVSQRPTEEMQWHLWTKCMNVAHLMSF